MGCSKSKTHAMKYLIICNMEGKIIYASDSFTEMLNYEKNALINKNLGIIMSPFVSNYHNDILLPKFANANKFQREIIRKFIGVKKNKPFMVYDAHKNSIYVKISVYIDYDKFHINFIMDDVNNNEQLYTSSNYLFKQITNKEFVQTKNKLIVISVDFKDSTKLLVSKGALKMIEINNTFHNDTIELIKKYYYPYIYIHEIIGDCFVFVCNSDWTYNIPNFCASMCLSFICMLYRKTNSYITIRVGISYDKLHYGYVDHNFRLFGNSMNLSSRYESEASMGKIVCCVNFYEKLLDEKIFTNIDLYSEMKTMNLKGFDLISGIEIDIKYIDVKNIFTQNINIIYDTQEQFNYINKSLCNGYDEYDNYNIYDEDDTKKTKNSNTTRLSTQSSLSYAIE